MERNSGSFCYEFSLLLILGVFQCYGQQHYPTKQVCFTTSSSLKCFFVFQSTRNHSEAVQFCRSQSAELLSSTNDYLSFLQQNFDYHLQRGVWFNNFEGLDFDYHDFDGTSEPRAKCFKLGRYGDIGTLEPVFRRSCYVLCYREYPLSATSPIVTNVPWIAGTTDVMKKQSGSEQRNKNIPIIVGVVIATLVVCAIIAVVFAIFIYRKRKLTKSGTVGTSSPSQTVPNQYKGPEEPSVYDNPQQPISASQPVYDLPRQPVADHIYIYLY